MNNKKDTIYSKKHDPLEPFTFNREVAAAFDDMAPRSIPGYRELQDMVSHLAVQYYREGTYIYDLGCSTGNTILNIEKSFSSHGVPFPPCIAIDSSREMIEIAREKCSHLPVTFQCGDIASINIVNASVVCSIYVLQFLQPGRRETIMKTIYNGLLTGGIFLFSEKLKSEHENIQSILTDAYHNFKRRNGYSDLEIQQKAEALKNILIPSSYREYCSILEKTGFTNWDLLFQLYQFAGIGAVK